MAQGAAEDSAGSLTNTPGEVSYCGLQEKWWLSLGRKGKIDRVSNSFLSAPMLIPPIPFKYCWCGLQGEGSGVERNEALQNLSSGWNTWLTPTLDFYPHNKLVKEDSDCLKVIWNAILTWSSAST